MTNATQTIETNAQRVIRICEAMAETNERSGEHFNEMATAQGESGPMFALDRQFQGYAEGKAAGLRYAVELIQRFENGYFGGGES